MTERTFSGTILVFNRKGRTTVCEAFRRAGWLPSQRTYIARGREDRGDVARYMTMDATRADLDRLYAAFNTLPPGGFEAYCEETSS